MLYLGPNHHLAAAHPLPTMGDSWQSGEQRRCVKGIDQAPSRVHPDSELQDVSRRYLQSLKQSRTHISDVNQRQLAGQPEGRKS